jgi:hypothetical protein
MKTSDGQSVLALILMIWMMYWYFFQKLIILSKRSENQKRADLLTIPISEIRSNSYDPDTIRRRLEDCEKKDLYVASIVFALLKLVPTAQSKSSLTASDSPSPVPSH